MEKKGSRSTQPLSKGIGTESKKSQDAINKPWPRGGRRREPNGGAFPKNETSRKAVPQRNKTVDKRPKPRGFYYTGAVGGKEEPGLEFQEAELGSVFVQGSKKQSLNHLLNFHFEQREGQSHSGLVPTKHGHRWGSTIKHKYNKEQFLQANCQFIVQESGDYKPYVNNPDTLVNWDLIEQVNIHVLEFPSCPICLYPPVAAKMTRCGHIYCWSCMLHYLALSDKTWRKCPICYEAVYKKDLKSVVAIPHATFNVNENITFKLMKRIRGSLTAYPAVQEIRDSDTPFNISNKDATNIYSKLLLAGKSEVVSIISRERAELHRQLVEDENCPEKCFIEQALQSLQEREECILSQNATAKCANLSRPKEFDVHSQIEDGLENKIEGIVSKTNSNGPETEMTCISKRERYESATSDTWGSEDSNLTAEDLEVPFADVKPMSSKCFYFYQALDGQHIYLHALNIRMLEHTYGTLEFCPKTIRGRIVEKESGSMTEDLRKRLRYLQHLPVTCQFEVAEIQLKQPVVTKETLEHFHDQIETRRKRRQRRARDEKRREKRIADEENKKLGKYAAANIRIESHYQFPEFVSDAAKAGTSMDPTLDTARVSPPSERSLSPVCSQTGSASVSGSLNAENEYSGLSFAKMLSSNKLATPTWPVRKSTAAGLPCVVAQSVPTRSHKQSDSDAEIEGYIPVPAFNQSFGDAIALALEKAALTNDDEDVKMNGKKKKKNKQKKILFATSMGYSGN